MHVDKCEYYLGKISTVSSIFANIQIENMSLLKYRFNQSDVLRPNTINYHVLIDSNGTIFETVKSFV
ncbi:hypothetical protein QP535_09955 [Lactobacillus crispatus]|uniref:hypothetical protein n=1 Tax=Lactobacillus crispatus TaxID=47770 RepID=UPI00254A440C|nr:hypothetical protein [Lactobacillus crispatus]MCZ3643399.1 hypothetical protein [Lactobacillus crispatus]MDK7583940.1 hypothetical protein [Lactobacillus crispatus]